MKNKIKTSFRSAFFMCALVGCGAPNAAQAVTARAVTTKAVTAKAATKEADEQRSPLGCRDVGYHFKLKVLKLLPEAAGDRASLYFIFNALDKPINLYQMLKNESTRSMYLNHVIRARQWAALSTDEKYLKYICTIDDPKLPYGKIVDCETSLNVCEFARVKYGMNNRGNIWLVDSNTRGGAVQAVLNYGIIPR